MPGLTPWDFVPPVSPIELRSGNRMHKLKTALSKYWTDHDKFIALVMAGSGIIFACVGGVLISLGLGLPLAIFLSYRRSATDIYTNARIVVHDLIKYPKYAHQVLALLQKVEHEEQIKSQEAENCDQTSCRKEETTEEKEDVFSSKMKEIKFQTRFAGDQLFPLNLVVLAKPLNPNNKEDVRVIGYLCVDHIGRICSEETQTEVEQLIENNDIETNEFLAESQKLGVHYDLLKRERKDLFAYTFGSVCILKTMVVAPEFRGQTLILEIVLRDHLSQNYKKNVVVYHVMMYRCPSRFLFWDFEKEKFIQAEKVYLEMFFKCIIMFKAIIWAKWCSPMQCKN